MDLEAYRRLHDSGWVRAQRDGLARGELPTCPIVSCSGHLEPYDDTTLGDTLAMGIPTPGGVRCTACGARSRSVAL
jgi:hypothetical protein